MSKREHHPSQTEKTVQSGLMARLRQYKEFIAILVFFLSGAAWIYGVFATKKQVDRLECLTTTNITLVRSQQDSEEQNSKMLRLIQQLRVLNDGQNPLTSAENKARLEMERDTAIKLRDSALKDYHDALKKLESNTCK